jgi:aspartate-semialdehyde dehydrogenase
MKIGIVGISGLVGQNILNSINLLNIKYSELYLFGNKSINKEINFNDENYEIFKFNENYFNILDYLFLAVDDDIANDIITSYRNNNHNYNKNCIIIDLSSSNRLDNTVPLIVPEINKNLITINNFIIANPNCCSIILSMLLKPLLNIQDIKKVYVSTYQASSGAGLEGYNELIEQTKNIVNNEPIQTNFWKRQYINNVFSHNTSIDNFTKYNKEELKIMKETRKILNKDFEIIPTCIRVPVLQSHSMTVNIEFLEPVNENDIYSSLNTFSGIKILNDEVNNQFPEPIISTNTPDIYVGRIRPQYNHITDSFDTSCWSFFICGDQLLKGASYNAVQILNECENIKQSQKEKCVIQ